MNHYVCHLHTHTHTKKEEKNRNFRTQKKIKHKKLIFGTSKARGRCFLSSTDNESAHREEE